MISKNNLYVIIILIFINSCGVKTGLYLLDGSISDEVEIELPDIPLIPPHALCQQDEVYTTIGRVTALYGGGEDDGEIVSYRWNVTSAPSGSNPTLNPQYGKNTGFTPDMTGDYTVTLTVIDNQGLSESCDIVVHSIVGPPVAICPEGNFETSVGRTVTIEGDGFDDVMIVSFIWEVVEAPEDSLAQPEPPNTPVTTFTPDKTGEYLLRLTVTDNQGESSFCEVRVIASGAPVAICPQDMVAPTRRPLTLHGEGSDDGVIVAWQWELLSKPFGSVATLDPINTQDTVLIPDKVGDYIIRLTVIDDTGLRDDCSFTVHAYPTPPDAICPPNITTTPLTRVEFEGNGEDDGYIVDYVWSLVSTPTGSSALPPDPPHGRRSSFMPDIAGIYTLQLTVIDNDGEESSCTFNITAQSGEGLRVEIYWNPPDRSCDTHPEIQDCDPSDVDLHLLHPNGRGWFNMTFDCYYANCQDSITGGRGLEWDQPVPNDNPRLDLDDIEGFGPENINISEPVIGYRYGVGVHYYSDDGRWGPSQVYVKIYCGVVSTTPVAEFGPVTLNVASNLTDPFANNFWKVAWIEWNGYSCNVIPRTNPDGSPVIVSGYEAMSSP